MTWFLFSLDPRVDVRGHRSSSPPSLRLADDSVIDSTPNFIEHPALAGRENIIAGTVANVEGGGSTELAGRCR